MIRIVSLLFFILADIGLTMAQDLLVQNANVVDVETGTYSEGQDILIENGTITDIRENIVEAGISIVDANGLWVIPGMIDAHIHMFQSGGLYTRPDAIDLTHIRPYTEEIKWLKESANDILQSYLRVGVTSVIDVGGPMYNYEIRAKYGDKQGAPRVFITGPLISTYQPEAFKIDDPPIIKVHTEEEAREEVRKQVSYRPDFIKIWYISLPNLPADSTFNIVRATIEESHQNGLKVFVHATQLNTAKLAIHAGADVLVHSVSQPIDQEFIKMLEDNDVVYIPTLNVSSNYDRAFLDRLELSNHELTYAHPMIVGQLQDIRHLDHEYLDWANEHKNELLKRDSTRDVIRKMNVGLIGGGKVTIATGSDAGNIGTLHASSYWRELEAMSAAGLSNHQILKASTIGAATAVSKQHELGSIEIGKKADLVFVGNNPLENLSTLRTIRKLVLRGKEIALSELQEGTPEFLVQEQLNAYNEGNIEAFLTPYADSVEVYSFPNQLLYIGKEKMRANYQPFFENTPDLYCHLLNRIVQGNTVIDQEHVTGLTQGREIRATAIYKVRNGKIREVYFDRGD